MRVMIIGDLKGQLIAASKIAISNGAKVMHMHEIDSAIHALCSGKGADVIMIASDMDIASLVTRLHSERIVVPVVACGIGDSPEIAVKAINAGAADYLPLPPNNELIAAVLESVAKKDLKCEMLYKSDAFSEIMNIAHKVAPTEANVLITGASGTGKEMMARFLHQNSKRSANEMITVNCAAIPEHLLESEMFGHEKGAFTGATERRIGKFEEANNGIIFLDEISEMDIKLQAKLLRVLQEKEVTRVGSNKAITLDIRIIAASNRNLSAAVAQGVFREDLFYRLNVINIALPNLNQRVEDVPMLCEHFIKKYAKINGVQIKTLHSNAMQKLITYSWPGNIRELENAMHRALLVSSGDIIQETDISLFHDANAIETLENVEKIAILKAIDVYGKNTDRAATALGISIKILRNKLEQYRLGDNK